MTKEDKELLIKDLCARLPYRLMVNCTLFDKSIIGRIYLLHHDAGLCYIEIDKYPDNWDLYQDFNPCVDFEFVKPYLRPMSSMTEEEINEFHKLRFTHVNYGSEPLQCVLSIDETDWLNAYHFDYRSLIEKGLALEAPEGMYNF